MKKIIISMIMVAFVLTPALVLPSKVQAVSVAEIQAQINALLAQIELLKSQAEKISKQFCSLTTDLSVGVTNAGQVPILRAYLFHIGETDAPVNNPIFDENLRQALVRYQAKNNISPANGVLGPITRAHINARLGEKICAYVEPTSGGLTIKGISGPTSIDIGKKGTWKIKATDDGDETLSYAVNWGDEGICPTGKVCAQFIKSVNFVQTATFSHTYSQAGVYKIVVTVKNSSGDTAEAGINVKVGNDNPIAGTPSIVDIDNDQIKTSYNPAKPQIPFLDLSFNAEIAAPENKDSYVWADRPVAFNLDLNGSDTRTGASFKVMQVNVVSGNTDIVTNREGSRFYRIRAGQSATFGIEVRYDTAVLFGGVYNGRVRGVYFDNNLNDQSGVSLVQSNIQFGNKLAIIGERAPYISNIESPVSIGEEMTITGQRLDLELNKLYIDGSWVDGGRIGGNGTSWTIAVPNNLRDGRHSLYIEHQAWGKSNTLYFIVNGGIVTPNCTNVWGDANQDKKLTAADAIFANDIYTGVVKVTSCSYKAADVNNDGRVTPADAQLISERLNVSVSVINNVQIVGNQPQWFNQQTRKTITWNYNNAPLNKSNPLRFKVGLYSDLNGGMWGNSTSVAVTESSGTQSAVITAKVGRPWFNVKNYIRVRLVNADGTDYRPQGRRIEAISAQTFEVVADDSVTTYHPADINTDKRIVNSEYASYCTRTVEGDNCLIAAEILRRGEIYSYDKVAQVYLDAKGQPISTATTPKISYVQTYLLENGIREVRQGTVLPKVTWKTDGAVPVIYINLCSIVGGKDTCFLITDGKPNTGVHEKVAIPNDMPLGQAIIEINGGNGVFARSMPFEVLPLITASSQSKSQIANTLSAMEKILRGMMR